VTGRRAFAVSRRISAPRLVGLALLVLASAAPPAGAIQWYEHYELALEAEARGDWQSALDHLEAAETFRREPAERVRTYGNRFLFDYDPSFHKARCMAELGRLGEARAELRASAAAGVVAAADLAALEARIGRIERDARSESDAEPGSENASRSARAAAQSPPGPEASAPAPSPDDRDETPRSVDAEPGRPASAAGRRQGRRESADGPDAREDAVPPGPAPKPVTSPAGTAGSGEPAAESPDRTRRDSDPGAADRLAPEPAESESTAEPLSESVSEPAGQIEPPPPSGAGRRPESPPDPPSPSSEGLPLPLVVLVGAALLLAAGAALAVGRRLGRRRSPSGSGTASGNGPSRRIGERVGSYRIEAVLGRGGMATTYRAIRRGDHLPVALKIPHETGDPTFEERFLREGRLGETLHHPGIVRVFEAGEAGEPGAGGASDGRPFLAMELLPGRTLRETMDAAGEPVPVERCLAIALEIAEALDYAHSKGVIHRDLKPENVMVLPDGTLKVMDFGVARVEGQPGLTTSRFFFGSPVYAAPELVDPRSIDRRVDLYSLGVLLYELLEGEPPFVHESVFKLLEMHQREPLPEPEGLPHPLPPEVWRLVARLLAKDPDDRYATAQELLVDLKRVLFAASS
jgi:hypothetical protein